MLTMQNPMKAGIRKAGKRLLAAAALVAGGLFTAGAADAAPFASGASPAPEAGIVQVQYGHHHGWGHGHRHHGWGRHHHHHGGWGHHRRHHGWGHRHHHRGHHHHRGYGYY